MHGPYILHIDPIIGTVGGVHLWWYGLGYAIAFVELWLFLLRNRSRLMLTRADVWSLALMFSAGVLLGGRLLQVFSTNGRSIARVPSCCRRTGWAAWRRTDF